jgi:hypothetical protein
MKKDNSGNIILGWIFLYDASCQNTNAKKKFETKFISNAEVLATTGSFLKI